MRMHQAAIGQDGGAVASDARGLPHGGLAELLSDHADDVMARSSRRPRPRGDARDEDMFRALTDINADGQATRDPRG